MNPAALLTILLLLCSAYLYGASQGQAEAAHHWRHGVAFHIKQEQAR